MEVKFLNGKFPHREQIPPHTYCDWCSILLATYEECVRWGRRYFHTACFKEFLSHYRGKPVRYR
jgi:hypothetical protein